MAGSRQSRMKSSAEMRVARELSVTVALAAFASALAYPAHAQDVLLPYAVVGDTIPASLTGAVRCGPWPRDRSRSVCGTLSALSFRTFPEERFQGTIAPDLKGAGARWSST